MAGLGHNNGPTLEGGGTWRTFAWTKARARLLPKLPLEVVRLRVKRAKALGLPYQTYAGIRASCGHDLVGFMFSSNALGKLRAEQVVPDSVVQKLSRLDDCKRIGLARPRIDLSSVAGLDQIVDAPRPHVSWSEMRDRMKAIARQTGHPADRFVLIGETMEEREWAEAARTAGYLAGLDYFAGDDVQIF